MSQISDPSSKQESAYTAYLERLVFLLSKRIVWNMKQEKFDDEQWATMFKKLYKNIYLRDKTREIGTRFSETIKELADALNVVPSDEWTMDSVTSRWSVLSRPLMLRRPSEDVSARRVLVRDKSKENKSCNNSFNESLSNHRNLSKPRRYESKVRAALDRIVDQSMRAFNPAAANSIDDQSFHSVLHPTNRFSVLDENQPSRDISFTTDSELPPVKPIVIKKRPQNNVNSKKRPQTPQMYYRGVFDVTATAKPANSIPSVNNIDKSVQQSRHSTVNDFEAIIAESKSVLKDYVSVVDHDPLPNINSNFNSMVHTPESQEENIIDFKKVLPQRNKLYGRTGTPLKAYTGSFYNQQPKSRSNSASKRDNSIMNEDNHKSSLRKERQESGKKVFLLNYNLDV